MFKEFTLAVVSVSLFVAHAHAEQPSKTECAKLRKEKFHELRDEVVEQVRPQIERNEEYVRTIYSNIWRDRHHASREFVEAYSARGAFATKKSKEKLQDLLRLYLEEREFDKPRDKVRCGSGETRVHTDKYGWSCRINKYSDAATLVPVVETWTRVSTARKGDLRFTVDSLGKDISQNYKDLSQQHDGSELSLDRVIRFGENDALNLRVCTTTNRDASLVAFGKTTKLWHVDVCSEVDVRQSPFTGEFPTIALDEVALLSPLGGDKLIQAVESRLPESCQYATAIAKEKAEKILKEMLQNQHRHSAGARDDGPARPKIVPPSRPTTTVIVRPSTRTPAR